MKKKLILNQNTSVEDFEKNYFYAVELKEFAKSIGVSRAAKLRKDQLEKIIKSFLSTGVVTQAIDKLDTSKSERDFEKSQLKMDTVVINYCSNKITKTFIKTEAMNIQPNLPKKSGVWYWINRWREEQLEKTSITYGDIVHQFIGLSNKKERLPRIPSTKFNNFISDFLEAQKGSRAEAIIAWEQLKETNIPKTFEAWAKQKT